jgi:hypothetical protein
MSDTSREDAYDEHVAPLMTKIIAFCKEHQIPMVASFELDADDDPDDPLLCTTILDLGGDAKIVSKALKEASQALQPKRPMGFTEVIETMPDGSKHITIGSIG